MRRGEGPPSPRPSLKGGGKRKGAVATAPSSPVDFTRTYRPGARLLLYSMPQGYLGLPGCGFGLSFLSMASTAPPRYCPTGGSWAYTRSVLMGSQWPATGHSLHSLPAAQPASGRHLAQYDREIPSDKGQGQVPLPPPFTYVLQRYMHSGSLYPQNAQPKLLLRLARLRLVLLVHEQHAPPRYCPGRSS